MMVRRAFIHTYCCQFGVLQHRSLSQAKTFLHHCHGPYLLKLKLLNILRLTFLYIVWTEGWRIDAEVGWIQIVASLACCSSNHCCKQRFFLHHFLLKLNLSNIIRLAFLYMLLGLDLEQDIGCVNPNCCQLGVLQHQSLISHKCQF